MYYVAGYGYLFYLCCGTPVLALTGLLICRLLTMGSQSRRSPATIIVLWMVLMVLLCCILLFILLLII